MRLTALLHDPLKEASRRLPSSWGSINKTLTAALDSGILKSRVSDALEKVLLAPDDLRALVDQRDDRRKWDLKGVHDGVCFKALPEGGLL